MYRAGLVAVLLFAACGDNLDDEDNRVINPTRESYETWIKVEPPGIVCGNGTPYKFWVNFSNKSDNLAVVFEPGGACWDYDSCAGRGGIRGAAHPDGLKDTDYDLASFISPFLSRVDDTSPSMNWNYVWVPYCTGDVHTGATTVTYDSGNAVDPDLEFHHDGHAAVQSVVSWIDDNFPHMPKLLSTGCSAGGVGSIVNYRFLRNGIKSVQKAYMINDSGPIFPSSGHSKPLHEKIRSSWNLDALTPEMPEGFTLDDMGTINTALADEFPDDRLGVTYFRRDYNFSLYSYERFYNLDEHTDKEQILSLWNDDTELLVDEFATRDNLYYFIPYYRPINDSHCTTLFNFVDSDIEGQNMTLAKWVDDFVNDRSVSSYIEDPVPGEDD